MLCKFDTSGENSERKRRDTKTNLEQHARLSVSLANEKSLLFLHILPSSKTRVALERKKDTQKEPTFMYFFARVFPFKTEEKEFLTVEFRLKIGPKLVPQKIEDFLQFCSYSSSLEKRSHTNRAQKRDARQYFQKSLAHSTCKANALARTHTHKRKRARFGTKHRRVHTRTKRRESSLLFRKLEWPSATEGLLVRRIIDIFLLPKRG